ncbi:MAG: HAD family hydrolase [Oscillospiraceae bacterium]|nr:HAD family hydrolase [Oscillospiraceae bacterium]
MTDTLFVTDLDGTLLQPDVTVSDRSFAILSELLERGLPLTVATARTSFSVMPILRGLPFRLPLILQNGSVLHDPVHDRIVHAAVIGAEAFQAVLALFAEFGFNGFVFCVPADQLECCYTELTTEHMRQYYAERRMKYDKPFRQVGSLHALTERNPVFLSLHGPPVRLDPLYARLRELPGISVTYYRDVYERDIWYLEVSAPDASKYHGICRLREMTGAGTVIGFGDNHNDIPLFRACDRKIAVGNAADELKSLADEIIGCNTENAVAEYLHALFS